MGILSLTKAKNRSLTLMRETVLTFHTMLEGCIKKDPRSWEYCISRYGAVSRRLIEKNFDCGNGELDLFLGEVLGSMCGKNCQFFSEFPGSSEREFVLYLRERILHVLRVHMKASHSPVLTIQILSQVFTSSPLAYQETAWLALKGYNDEVTGKILRVPVSLSRKGRGELMPRLAKYVDEAELPVLRLDDTVLAEVESLKGPNCIAVKAFSKVIDGQMPWREKQVIEQHIGECLNCLDRITYLKETIFHLRSLPPLEEELVRRYMDQLTFVQGSVASHSSFLTRMFKVFR